MAQLYIKDKLSSAAPRDNNTNWQNVAQLVNSFSHFYYPRVQQWTHSEHRARIPANCVVVNDDTRKLYRVNYIDV